MPAEVGLGLGCHVSQTSNPIRSRSSQSPSSAGGSISPCWRISPWGDRIAGGLADRRLPRTRYVARMKRLAATFIVTAAVLGGGGTPAPAAVTIGEEQVVVETRAGRAVVDRAPFGIRFEDAAGEVLLREIGKRPGRARELPRTEDPEPLALERRPDTPLYAPLSFEVGRENLEQWDAGLWTGNALLRPRREGVVHFPRRVIAARPAAGGGVRLVVSTTDPGRELIVGVGPDGAQALRVTAQLTNGKRVISFADSVQGQGERGLPRLRRAPRDGRQARREALRLHRAGEPRRPGHARERGDAAADPDRPLERLHGRRARRPGARFPRTCRAASSATRRRTGPTAPTTPRPSSSPRAATVSCSNQAQFSRWRMGNDRDRAWQVQVSAPRLDYSVALAGRPASAAAALTAITGRQPVAAEVGAGSGDRHARSRSRRCRGRRRPRRRRPTAPRSSRTSPTSRRTEIELSAYTFEGWALLDDLDYVRSVIDRLHAPGCPRDPLSPRLRRRRRARHPGRGTTPRRSSRASWRRPPTARPTCSAPTAAATPPCSTSPTRRRSAGGSGGWSSPWALGMDGFMQDFGEQVQRRHALRQRRDRPHDAQPLPGRLAPAQPPDPRRLAAPRIPTGARSGSSPAPDTAAARAARRMSGELPRR